jgi:hypothetical protein
MTVEISVEDTMSAYEPIDSEFRARAWKRWRNRKGSSNMFGPRYRFIEPDASVLPSPKNGFVGIDGMETVVDYFPLDSVICVVPGPVMGTQHGTFTSRRVSSAKWNVSRQRSMKRRGVQAEEVQPTRGLQIQDRC